MRKKCTRKRRRKAASAGRLLSHAQRPFAKQTPRSIKNSMEQRSNGSVDLTKNYTTGAGFVDGTVGGPMLEREMALKHEAYAIHTQYQNMKKETLDPAPRLLPRETLKLRKARIEALSPFGQIAA